MATTFKKRIEFAWFWLKMHTWCISINHPWYYGIYFHMIPGWCLNPYIQRCVWVNGAHRKLLPWHKSFGFLIYKSRPFSESVRLYNIINE